MTFCLTSPAFVPGGEIPRRHTGRGEDLSPALHFAGVPRKTRSLAVVMDDWDIPLPFLKEYTHWCIWNLPPSAGLAEGVPHGARLEDGAVQGLAYGHHRYRGPKPPFGSHRYVFCAYALDCVLALHPNSKKPALLAAMEGHVLARSELMGRFPAR